jgi:2,4-dienoyl-CoA reductase-like NADH-dependent reductase (Old Yellow Enzyme family)
MPTLFDPLVLGDLTLPNRIIMAPLTRARAGEARVPNELMAEYYRQRASAGLIISEAISVTPMGVGYANTPGLWSAEQVQGWKAVTKAVHGAGGRIFAQLWHVGRISSPVFLNNEPPVAPSAIAAQGYVSLVRPKQEYPVPRALATEEIPGVVEAYRKAAMNAQMAGFDGVEIHGANGYLLDQFLQDGSNQRADEYGGSLVNRARLMLEVTDACTSVWEPGQVGMHLAPRMDAHSMGDSDRLGTFTYVARELGERGIAFICTREHKADDWISPQLRRAFGGVFIVNEGFTLQMAQQVMADDEADAVAWGKLFIANPDLVERFANGETLNEPQPDTFYAHGATGYTDYPALHAVSSGV